MASNYTTITRVFAHAVINPRRACAARVTVVVLSLSVCVCVYVDAYSGTTGYEAAR